MPINVALLKEICETPGAPGYEQQIREVVIREVKPLVDKIEIDNLGNVTAIKYGKNKGKKIMAAAHMDEIGFIVSHIDEKGFIRFHPLGGFDPKTLTSQRVIIHGKEPVYGVLGSKPIHVMTPEERTEAPKITDFFIDCGLSREEAIEKIEVGSPITRDRDLIEMGNCVCCKSIDNRVSVFILIETLSILSEVPYDFYAVFTVQEEVGIRGAQVASMKYQPDFGFGIDTTIAFDVPGAQEHEMVTRLGEGTGIKIMDSSVLCDYRMVNYMKEIATQNKIKWQPELLPAGGTDTSGIQLRTPGGAITGAVSIPTRHIHQTTEMANKEDIFASILILKHCIENLDKGNWNF